MYRVMNVRITARPRRLMYSRCALVRVLKSCGDISELCAPRSRLRYRAKRNLQHCAEPRAARSRWSEERMASLWSSATRYSLSLPRCFIRPLRSRVARGFHPPNKRFRLSIRSIPTLSMRLRKSSRRSPLLRSMATLWTKYLLLCWHGSCSFSARFH